MNDSFWVGHNLFLLPKILQPACMIQKHDAKLENHSILTLHPIFISEAFTMGEVLLIVVAEVVVVLVVVVIDTKT